MFTSLLIHTCNIQSKTLATVGYEEIASWTTIATSVPCRYNANTQVSINDSDQMRINKDNDTFFFDANVVIDRGNKIVFQSKSYDVIKVNKIWNAKKLHHIEVEARFIDKK